MRRLMALAAALMLALALAPTAAADEHGTNRPFRSDISGIVYWTFEPMPDCPVQTVGEAMGLATHMGAVTWWSSHCPPAVLPVYSGGHLVFTAANGDTLTADYDINGDPPYYADVTGGTGRFSHASGRLGFHYVVTQGQWGPDGPIAPWYVDWHFKGTISY